LEIHSLKKVNIPGGYYIRSENSVPENRERLQSPAIGGQEAK
jgi:hypothetical protein